MAERAPRISVSVVYALPQRQTVIDLTLDAGARVADAVAASGLVERFDLDLNTLQTGVFGRRRDAAAALADGDRVELYRPLLIDPKQRRRRRAQG